MRDFDPERVGFFTRPDYYDLLTELRREAPVHRYAPNSWTVAAYRDVRVVSRDPETYCSGQGVLMNDPKRSGAELPGSILHMDPPEHAAWRRMASRWFTPRATGELEGRVRNVVDRVLADVSLGEEVDLVGAVAAPIPVLVIAELLGIAGDADAQQFRQWSDACIEGAESSPDEADALARMDAVGELLAFLTAQVQGRRTAPRDDLLTALVEADVEGRRLRDDEAVMYCMSVLVAGNETTRHLISGSLDVLAAHPHQRAELASADDQALNGAVEECLRWVTPIQSFGRTATRDLELHGQKIESGDWLVLLYSSANRDETVFGPDADRFDIHRPPNPAHLAFGFGEHLCLGASLARLEARVALQEFLARFPDYTVTGPPTWAESTLVRGFVSLPVRL